MKTLSLRAAFIASLFFLPGSFAHAAQISFTTVPATPTAGKEFTITVRLDTQTDSPNVLQGSISLPKEFLVEGVSTGGSGLTLWPVEPHFVPAENLITFAGGVPGGLPPQTEATLFSIRAKVNTVGTYASAAGSIEGFRNDGAGTTFPIPVPSYAVTIASPSIATPAAPQTDTTPPQFISADIGRDPSLFDNQYYLTLFATDDASGVTSYEVKEGWFGTYVKANTYYVLKDQSLRSPIWVRITDAAGNSTTKEINSPALDATLWCILGGILVGAAIGFALYVRYQRRRRAL